mmetsp:Transcript_17935/g.52321  ORF Transcript_17935/g.52321 Transcript_17935/m.52321 type:complete len:344 (+) Transcript_17935:6630-7661(+)
MLHALGTSRWHRGRKVLGGALVRGHLRPLQPQRLRAALRGGDAQPHGGGRGLPQPLLGRGVAALGGGGRTPAPGALRRRPRGGDELWQPRVRHGAARRGGGHGRLAHGRGRGGRGGGVAGCAEPGGGGLLLRRGGLHVPGPAAAAAALGVPGHPHRGDGARPRPLQGAARVRRPRHLLPRPPQLGLHPRPPRAAARVGRGAQHRLRPHHVRLAAQEPSRLLLRRRPGGVGARGALPHAALPPRRVPQRGQTRRGLRRDGRELLRPGGRAAAAHARRRARHLRLRPPGAALLPDRPRRGGADAGPQRAHPAHAAGGAAEPHALHPRGAVRRRQPDRKPRDAAVH